MFEITHFGFANVLREDVRSVCNHYLHYILYSRFNDTECRARDEVAQNPEWAEQVGENEAVLGEDAVFLAIKVYPPTLQGEMRDSRNREESRV